MSLFIPEYLRMATGSKQNLKLQLLEPIKKENIVVYPDKGEFNDWNAKITELQKQGFKILEELEKRNITDVQYLDKIGDIYHTINSNMREEFYKGLE